MTTVGDLGEFGLIERLAGTVAAARLDAPAGKGFQLLLGIGDDAAAWRSGPGVMVSTTDTMVEGVHFTQATTPWQDVGWKVMAANLSDVAAMGALPTCAVVTLGLPRGYPVSAVDALYEGMLEACKRYHFLLVGGDIVHSSQCFVTVAINGVCLSEPLTRSSARVGDAIAVTGQLGGSAGGLRLLQSGAVLDSGAANALVSVHRRPQPRLEEGQRLVSAGIRCAMDVSDGLLADLAKLCQASGVAARVHSDQVPMDSSLRQMWPDHALQMALNGGEEYELLFAGDSPLVSRVVADLPHGAVIGEITAGKPGSVSVHDRQGRELAVASSGWDHMHP